MIQSYHKKVRVMLKSETLLKTVSLYLLYFLYTYFASAIISLLPMINGQVIMAVLDILFILIALFCYKGELKQDLKELKSKYKTGQIVKIVLLGVVTMIALNAFTALLAQVFNSNVLMDDNTASIQVLAGQSMIYTIFKMMIFGVVAEEILFRESLNKVLTNNILFVIVSTIIYTGMHFVFVGAPTSIFQVLPYVFLAILLGTIYVKNDRNIVLVMLIKFAYNLIPLIGLFVNK